MTTPAAEGKWRGSRSPQPNPDVQTRTVRQAQVPKTEELRRILLDRDGTANGDEITFRCVFPERHANGDEHPSGTYNVEKGLGHCRVCSEKWSEASLATLVGLDLGRGITLAQYAELKKLPLDLLIGEGVTNHIYDSNPAVWIPAPCQDGSLDGAGQLCRTPRY